MRHLSPTNGPKDCQNGMSKMKALIEWSGFTCMKTNRKPQQGAPASGMTVILFIMVLNPHTINQPSNFDS